LEDDDANVAVAISGTPLVGACHFTFMPQRAIPSFQEHALKLGRQTLELQQQNHEAVKCVGH
jgi:hypothetical protein